MILEYLKKKQYKEVYELLKPKEKVSEYKSEYNNDRKIRSSQVGKREDKTIKTENSSKIVPVLKLPICYPKKVVLTASTFLFGNPVKLIERVEKNTDDTEEFQKIKNLWEDLRIDPMLLKFAEVVKSETEATIILYTKQTEDGLKLKTRLITSENGKVMPFFDEYGDLVLFAWEYVIEDKNKPYLMLFTADEIITLQKEKDNYVEIKKEKNLFGKIPVVYHSQKKPEWFDVKELIDRYEMRFSRLGDTNDYFGDPIWKAIGSVKSMPKKDDSGKMVKVDIQETESGKIVQSDLDVITWNHAPESIKLELETLKSLINDLSSTPNLTLQDLKGMGNIANYAMELMFLAPIIKAKNAEGDYQIVISRLINLLKTGMINILKDGSPEVLKNLRIDVEFTSVLPKNIRDVVETLMEATGGKPILSTQSAVGMNPLVEDAKAEIEKIEEEEAKASVLDLGDAVDV